MHRNVGSLRYGVARRYLVLLMLPAVAVGLGLIIWRLTQTETVTPSAEVSGDPRLSFATPYRNVHPNVKYVGDNVCAICHDDICASYANHPMGRASIAMSDQAPRENLTASVKNPFEKFGFTFRVENRDGQTFHRETRFDDAGKVLAEIVAPVKHVVGSGTRGRSYLVDRDGYLFQSPISWYSESQSWDTSPGFTGSSHFARPVTPHCLFCHCNAVEPMNGPSNRYKQPVFNGYPIGCERCHGPGELHTDRYMKEDAPQGFDDTIVNPKRLEPMLRDAVCEQCHLQGEQRILAKGRDVFDYRPGLPLDLFWKTFVRIPQLTDYHRAVGTVQQMTMSRCYKESQGKFGCISCHNPHERPEKEAKISHFRGRCLSCHAESACKIPIAERKTKDAADYCISCHMHRTGSSNIAHTAVTDHRILRRPEPGKAVEPYRLMPGESPVAPFHPPRNSAEASRDLGVALSEITRGLDSSQAGHLADIAMPLVLKACDASPHDHEAHEAAAQIFRVQRRHADSLMALDHLLADGYERERVLVEAASLAAGMGQEQKAIDYWKRAIAISPHVAYYHWQLARILSVKGDWPATLASIEKSLKIDPFNTEARVLLVTGLFRLGKRGEAKTELERTVALSPKDSTRLREWFDRLSR